MSFLIPTTFFFVLYAVVDKSHVDQRSKNNSTCFLDVDYDAFGDQQRASKLSTITAKVRATLHIYIYIYIYIERGREEDCFDFSVVQYSARYVEVVRAIY